MPQDDYDLVIVGAGVAGALCAWRLSQGPNPPRILLLEEGDNGLDDAQRQAFVKTYMEAAVKGSTSPYTKLDSAKVILSPESGSNPAVLNQYFVEADRKSTRLNSSHTVNSYAVFCLKQQKAEGTVSLSRKEERETQHTKLIHR